MNQQTYFVSGIGTEVGKTVISAILCKALKADYWKPVQAGDLDNTDSHKVEDWSGSKIHPERFKLNHPMSPHAAAERDNVEINLEDFKIPSVEGPLIIEGAGGLYVPLNQKDCMIDLIKKMNVPMILVSRNYLGSINHTLLSIEAVKAKGIEIAGIIFNGKENTETQEVIAAMSGVKVFGRVDELAVINKESIEKEARKLSKLF